MNAKLFHLLHEVDVTHDAHYNPVGKTYSARRIVVPASFAVTWPDGMPCSLVEIYLISRFRRGASVREDGGSLRAIVAKLSHLIRNCCSIQKDFWELDDEAMDVLVINLMEEKKPDAPMVRVRDNNTVRSIVAAAVDFLLWLQDEMLKDVKLIGVGPQYRIRLVERKEFVAHRNRFIVHAVYPRLPPRDTREPKRPISSDKRNALWQAVGKLASVDLVQPTWARRSNNAEMLTSYLKARRELLLELLEATGARPGELARLSASRNEDCYRSQELILMTLKRRRHFERKIKLQPGVAMRLTIFLRKHRTSLLNAIQVSGGKVDPKDRVFLGVSGSPMSERSMGSEFSRISKLAGLSRLQSCMSMFRHRFITKQVAIHLSAYLGEGESVKGLVTGGDYRTILKKVATTTGHGNENSLMHYIDLAWEELGTTKQINKAIAIDASIERAVEQVISLTGSLETVNKKSAIEIVRETVELLRKLQIEIQSAQRT